MSIIMLKMFSKMFFYVHDIKVIVGGIGLPIRKLIENTSIYPIMDQTKTSKCFLTKLKTKHNVTVLQNHVV
jgi:hypothetical protein